MTRQAVGAGGSGDASPGGGPPAETAVVVRLPSGELAYTLRRSARSRGMRITIDPSRGVVVTVPLPTRRGWGQPGPRIEAFLLEREPWLRRHLARHEDLRGRVAGIGRVAEGGTIRFRGELHRVRLEAAAPGERRSSVAREGDLDGDVIVVRTARRDRRTPTRVVTDWCRDRAREAIDRAIAIHAPALGVAPAAVVLRDPRTRWGSASRHGRIAFSWRLVLAPPQALDTVVVHELAHLRIFGHGPRFWDLVATRQPDHLAWRRWLRAHAFELHSAFDPAGAGPGAPAGPAPEGTPEGSGAPAERSRAAAR